MSTCTPPPLVQLAIDKWQDALSGQQRPANIPPYHCGLLLVSSLIQLAPRDAASGGRKERKEAEGGRGGWGPKEAYLQVAVAAWSKARHGLDRQ
jgi:hypothetical protein